MKQTAYGGFAAYYDRFMDDIPYDAWADYLHGLLTQYGVTDGLVLELGCGTGAMTRRLSHFGYDMIGLDVSEEMLELAQSKEAEGENASGAILYLHQDMREFELYGTVAAVISVCDSMNYITEPEELQTVFRLANNYLDAQGLFVFDLKTPYYYRVVLGQNVFADNREDCSLLWENYFDEESGLNEYDLTIYCERENGLYERLEETHCQQAWSLSEITDAIQKAGMEFVTAYDAFTREPPRADSERIYVVAREQYQEGKQYAASDGRC